MPPTIARFIIFQKQLHKLLSHQSRAWRWRYDHTYELYTPHLRSSNTRNNLAGETAPALFCRWITKFE
jgi:hypothetical protein